VLLIVKEVGHAVTSGLQRVNHPNNILIFTFLNSNWEDTFESKDYLNSI
jgi:hypothetical protein